MELPRLDAGATSQVIAWWRQVAPVRPPERSTAPEFEDPRREREVRRILFWILWANLALVVVKLVIGWRLDSLAVLGDAAHSGVDTINNLVGLTAVHLAAAPPDEEHPYGHGKFETLGALAIAGFLSITCFELVRSAVGRIISDAPPPDIALAAILILAGTMLVNVIVAVYESRRGRQLGSELLTADARHTQADVLVTLSVLAGLGLVRLGWGHADAVLAMVVAALVAHSGVQILRRTVPVLVDHRVVDAERLGDLALEVDGVESVTEIRSRGRPGEGFAELTVRVHPGTTVRAAHVIADEVERVVAEALDLRNVVVHVEPSELH